MKIRRRRVLGGIATGAIISLAGCGAQNQVALRIENRRETAHTVTVTGRDDVDETDTTTEPEVFFEHTASVDPGTTEQFSKVMRTTDTTRFVRLIVDVEDGGRRAQELGVDIPDIAVVLRADGSIGIGEVEEDATIGTVTPESEA